MLAATCFCWLLKATGACYSVVRINHNTVAASLVRFMEKTSLLLSFFFVEQCVASYEFFLLKYFDRSPIDWVLIF